MVIVIGSNFGYAVLAAVGITLQCFATAVSITGARKKYNVNYPDNGGGRYSDKLSDEDWVAFNNIKRTSDNYLEQVGMVLVALVLAGLYQPKLAASFGAVYIVGRFAYTRGYVAGGADRGVSMALRSWASASLPWLSLLATTLLPPLFLLDRFFGMFS